MNLGGELVYFGCYFLVYVLGLVCDPCLVVLECLDMYENSICQFLDDARLHDHCPSIRLTKLGREYMYEYAVTIGYLYPSNC